MCKKRLAEISLEKTNDSEYLTSGPHIEFVFFFNDTATTEIYTLSLHDALPIYIAVITLLHPLLGALALSFALILLALAVLNERLISGSLVEAGEAGARS